MAALVSSGTTASLTVDTTTTIADVSAAGVYQTNVVVTALVTGEFLEVAIYAKGTSATGAHRVFFGTQAWYDADKMMVSPPYISNIQYVATLRQRGGTGRAFPFNISSA